MTDSEICLRGPLKAVLPPPHLPATRSHHDSLHHWQKELSTTATQFSTAQRKLTWKAFWEPLLHWCSALQCEGQTLGEQQRSMPLETCANHCRFRASVKIWVLNYWHPWNPFHWSYISFQAAIPSKRKIQIWTLAHNTDRLERKMKMSSTKMGLEIKMASWKKKHIKARHSKSSSLGFFYSTRKPFKFICRSHGHQQ